MYFVCVIKLLKLDIQFSHSVILFRSSLLCINIYLEKLDILVFTLLFYYYSIKPFSHSILPSSTAMSKLTPTYTRLASHRNIHKSMVGLNSIQLVHESCYPTANTSLNSCLAGRCIKGWSWHKVFDQILQDVSQTNSSINQ